jgi:hypothetical protein
VFAIAFAWLARISLVKLSVVEVAVRSVAARSTGVTQMETLTDVLTLMADYGNDSKMATRASGLGVRLFALEIEAWETTADNPDRRWGWGTASEGRTPGTRRCPDRRIGQGHVRQVLVPANLLPKMKRPPVFRVPHPPGTVTLNRLNDEVPGRPRGI